MREESAYAIVNIYIYNYIEHCKRIFIHIVRTREQSENLLCVPR